MCMFQRLCCTFQKTEIDNVSDSKLSISTFHLTGLRFQNALVDNKILFDCKDSEGQLKRPEKLSEGV